MKCVCQPNIKDYVDRYVKAIESILKGIANDSLIKKR